MAAGWGRLSRYGALFTFIALAGCVSSPPPRPVARAPIDSPPPNGQQPPRSDRGNPPFYDVLGKRYYVLKSSEGYRQRGIASWYGRDFHGSSTSSGEPYNMYAMTAAHTTLPLPTWVEVTNLSNGKKVIVKVNDRGPFLHNRLIDLSYAAALELDMVRDGTARVEVRALDAPPVSAMTVAAADPSPVLTAPSLSAAAPFGDGAIGAAPAPLAAEQMFVQAGAFSDRGNAERLAERLRASGFANPVVVSDAGGRKTLHRVRVGPVRDAEEFDLVQGRLRTLGVADSHLVVDR